MTLWTILVGIRVIAKVPLILGLILSVSIALRQASADNEDTIQIFTGVYPELEEGVALIDEQRALPESAFFRKDKQDKQEDINEFLDEAVAKLEFPDIQRYRREIIESRQDIERSRALIAQYRRAMLKAPEETTLGMESFPLFVSKQGYRHKIELEEKNIERYKEFEKKTAADFLERVRSLGIELTQEQFDVLLSTVNGDDFLQMAVAFEAVKGVTQQLQKLTSESGEDVVTARKYYGMYTVLLRMLDHMQRKFIDDIDNKHLPKLEEFEKAARKNIDEAYKVLEEGGEQEVLQSNIQANKLTLQAMEVYRGYLQNQESEMADRNGELQRQMRVADNTYNTVALASEVVNLLQTGIRSFEALQRLSPPQLTEFKNEQLREEFSKLTELMKR